MKKLFSFFMLAVFFGIFSSQAVTTNFQLVFNRTELPDAYNYINVENLTTGETLSFSETASPSFSLNYTETTVLKFTPVSGYEIGVIQPLWVRMGTTQPTFDGSLSGNNFGYTLTLEPSSENELIYFEVNVQKYVPVFTRTVNVPVTINLPEDAADAISSVTFLGEPVNVSGNGNIKTCTLTLSERYTGTEVPDTPLSGYLSINFLTDQDGRPVYDFRTVTMTYNENGFKSSGGSRGAMFEIISTYTNVVITVIPAGADINFKLNINNPASISVTDNEGNPIQLVSTENELSLNPANNPIHVSANKGYQIVEVTYATGQHIEALDEMTIEVTEGDVFNFTTIEAKDPSEYTDFFYVWVDDTDEGSFSSVTLYTENGAGTPLSPGLNTIPFANEGISYQIQAVTVNPSASVYPYINGLTNSVDGVPNNMSKVVYFGIPVNDTFISLYLNKPEVSTVVFETANGVSEKETNIYTDNVRVSGWSYATSPYNALDGTILNIYVPDTYSVEVNGSLQTPIMEEIEGVGSDIAVYEITVKENMVITITGDGEDHTTSGPTTGIEGIDAETLQNSIIYNLNGMRINNVENLRPGIYIVNGRKVVVSRKL